MKKYVIILLLICRDVHAMNSSLIKKEQRPLVESVDEFITRIQSDKIPRTFTDGDLFAWCPQGTKTALLEFFSSQRMRPVLKIAKEDVIYTTQLERRFYESIAISSQAQMMAFSYSSVKQGKRQDNLMLELRPIQLKKKNDKEGIIIVEENKQELPQLSLIPRIIAFNKQGTHIIALENDYLFMIFELKNNQAQIDNK